MSIISAWPVTRPNGRAIRKERNYLEIKADLQGSLTSYNDSWIAVSGGDNSIALTATLFLKHTFTKNLFTVETIFNAKMGYNRMRVETTNDDGSTDSNGVWFKNLDEFDISVSPAFKMSKNWSYGSIFKFRSQFVNGYVSRTEQERKHLKSTFMTPGYLDISFGFTYNCPVKKFPIVINLSPLSLNATFAESDWIRRRQVDKDGNEIKPAYSYLVSRTRPRRRNTRAARPFRSTSTGPSASRTTCTTRPVSRDSTAG